MTRNLRTLIYLLNLELREECSRTLGPGMGWNPVCNRGAAVEADAIGRAAVQADAIGEQQSKRTRSGAAADHESGEQQRRNRGAAAGREAEANGEQRSGSGYRNRAREQQLKRTQAASSS